MGKLVHGHSVTFRCQIGTMSNGSIKVGSIDMAPILLSSWPCLDGNILTNGIKVIIYAYAHMIIDYYGLKMIFEIFELIKSLKFKKIGRF